MITIRPLVCVASRDQGSHTLNMSSRRPANDTASVGAMQLRSELQQLKEAHIAAENAAKLVDTDVADTAAPLSPKNVECASMPTFESMSGTEQAAGSLGVHPEAWRPIKFMNNAHYDQLLKSNAIGDTLARRIEAFRAVASQ